MTFVRKQFAEPYGIHWFRRDLRVSGNTALRWNWRENKGRVVGVFFFDQKFLGREDFSHNRFAFFLKTLKSLKADLQKIGSDLLVLNGGPQSGWESLMAAIKKQNYPLPKTCSFNRDYEPFALERDSAITQFLSEKWNIAVHTERDHLILEPDEVRKPDGSFYQIYTPFSNRWLDLFLSSAVQERLNEQREGLSYLSGIEEGGYSLHLFKLTWADIFGLKNQHLKDCLDDFIMKNQKKVTVAIPPAGELQAWKALKKFQSHCSDYDQKRDFPALDGTSRLSLYFKNGSLTTAQTLLALNLIPDAKKRNGGKFVFLKELIWREFYYHILFHRPRVEKEAFQPRFIYLPWENREDFFTAWKEGKTGYPIVDAGMRQLKETGWMHNRVRMIVASYLTKDLLIDWRWGEKWFMQNLLDGDLAPNNGGWQWAASTGCDAQPYFRIFNPRLQGEKFDPRGDYIKKFVPELKDTEPEKIHAPWEKGGVQGYPKPIVDHAAQKEKVLRLYKSRAAV